MRNVKAFLALLLTTLCLSCDPAYADAVIFNGDYVKALKDKFKLMDTADILTGTADPSSVATSAPKGSLYLRQTAAGDGALYVKKDAGSSTNWSLLSANLGDVVGPASAVDNTLPRYDGVTGKLIQGSGVTVSDANAVSGAGIDADTNTITNIENADIKAAAAIDATKIADGSVTSSEFQFINTLTSNAQTQLNAKVDEVVSTDNAVTRFDGIGGAVQNSGVTIDDDNGITSTTSSSYGVQVTHSGVSAAINAASSLNGAAATAEFVKGGTGGTVISFANNSNGMGIDGYNGSSSNPTASFKNGNASGPELRLVNASSQTIDLNIPAGVTSWTFSLPIDDGSTGQFLQTNGSGVTTWATPGNVTGAASSTDEAIARMDGTTGKIIQNSGVTINDSNAMSGADFIDSTNQFVDNGDTSKEMQFQLSGVTTATTRTMTVPNVSGTLMVNPAGAGLANQSLVASGNGTTWSSTAPPSAAINVVANNSAAVDTTGWSASGAGITVARTTTAGDLPLSSTIPTGIKITPVSGTSDYVSYCVTNDEGTANRMLGVTWWQRPHASYTAGDLKFDVYRYAGAGCTSTATRVDLSTDSSGVTSIAKYTGAYPQISFSTVDTTTAPSYQVRFTRTAGTNPLTISQFFLGSPQTQSSVVVSDWQSYTPTITNGATTSALTAFWRRNGDSIDLQFRAIFNGAGSGTFTRISLPNGWTVDTSKLPAGNSSLASQNSPYTTLGRFYDASAATSYPIVGAEYNSSGGVTPVYSTTITGFSELQGTALASGDELSFGVRGLPIAEFAGGGTLNVGGNSQEEFACSTTGTWDAAAAVGNTVYGPAGCPISGSLTAARDKAVRWLTPIQPTDKVVLELQLNATEDKWIDANLTYAAPFYGPSFQSGVFMNDFSGGTDMTVTFKQYAGVGTTYNSTTGAQNWASASIAAWRLRKTASGAATGFGLATATQSGLVNPYTVGSGVVYSESKTAGITLTNSTNVSSSTFNSMQYTRVGNVVTGALKATISVSSSNTESAFFFSLPVSSDFTATTDATGTVVARQSSTVEGIGKLVEGDTADRILVLFKSGASGANHEVGVSFSYVVK